MPQVAEEVAVAKPTTVDEVLAHITEAARTFLAAEGNRPRARAAAHELRKACNRLYAFDRGVEAMKAVASKPTAPKPAPKNGTRKAKVATRRPKVA